MDATNRFDRTEESTHGDAPISDELNLTRRRFLRWHGVRVAALSLAPFLRLDLCRAAAAESGGGPLLPGKKGVGLPERKEFGAAHLEKVEVDWYYNWGLTTELKTKARFVPMVYSGRRTPPEEIQSVLLGFNEPDHPDQANISVEDALAKWPELAAKARYMVGPGMAGNPLTRDWFPRFMGGKPRVDAMAVHWYKGADASKFTSDMEEIYRAFKLPLWITEFAPQTKAASAEKPDEYSQRDVDNFIKRTVAWMEKTRWVEAYAWHHSYAGTSALYDDHGELTATGRSYAAARR